MSPKTRRGYEYQVRCLVRFTGREPQKLTQADIDRFREGCILSPVTIEAAIKAAGLLRGQRFGGTKLKRPRSCIATIPLDDLSRVYAAAKNRGNVFIARFLKWSYITGFRLGDLLALSRERMSRDVIELDASKSDKYHAVPRHPILRCRLPACEFPLRRSPSRLRTKIKYYCDLARVPHFGPQMIRRTAATQYELARPGAGGIIQGSALVGSDAVTWRYYINQVQILSEAQLRLAIPEAMRPKSLRTRRRLERQQLLEAFERISDGERATLLKMVSRL